MSARITIEHSRSREVSISGSISTTDDHPASSPVEVPSLSPTTASAEDYISDDDDEDWHAVDDIEPSESASRPASRPPPSAKNRVYVETGPPATIRRVPSRQRLPPAPEPEPPRQSRREDREPQEFHEPHRSRHRQQRRRDPSSHSDSVGPYEHYPGHGRFPYSHGAPPPHPAQQWEFVQHHQPQHGYPPSSVGSQAHAYNPFTGNPMAPPGAQLVHYQQPHPTYYPNPHMPQYPHGSPLSPTTSLPSNPYFDHRVPTPHMPVMPMQFYPSYPMHPMHAVPPMASPPAPADGGQFDKFQEMLLNTEKARMQREEAREAKIEAAREAAEIEATKRAHQAEAAEKLVDAEKKAKAAAEAEAEKKFKAADLKYKKALEEMKKKAEAAETAEKAAKKEADELRPADAPIKFKDAVGRTFSFPWQLCKTWKGIEALIKQAFLHVDVTGQHVQEGHYDLVGPNGEIILPQVWESTVQPDWTVTMHMWPMAEEKKKEMPKPHPPPAAALRSQSADRGWLGRRKSKKKKSPPVIAVPVRRPSNADAAPPPPPAAPLAPHGTVLPDAVVVDSSGAAQVVKEKRTRSRDRGVPPLLAWSAASMGVRRSRR